MNLPRSRMAAASMRLGANMAGGLSQPVTAWVSSFWAISLLMPGCARMPIEGFRPSWRKKQMIGVRGEMLSSTSQRRLFERLAWSGGSQLALILLWSCFGLAFWMIGTGIIASLLLRYMGDAGKKGGNGKSGTIAQHISSE